MVLQLAYHCNNALDKETLPLLYPLVNLNHTNVSITASITLDIYVKTAITHVYTVGLGLGYIYTYCILHGRIKDKNSTTV